MTERRCRPAVWICVAALAAGAAACGDEVEAIIDARVGDARPDGPTIDAPAIDAPDIDAPAIDAPAIDAPTIDAPAIDAPAIDAPAIDAPAIDASTTIDASTAIDAAAIDASTAIDAAAIDASTLLDAVFPDGTSIDAAAAPSASAAPTEGLATASTAVQFTGTDLVAGTTVTFNGAAGVGCTYQPPTMMTCQAPPAAVGRGPIVVTNPGGSTILGTPWTYTGVRNETDVPAEVDYCNLQFPAAMSAAPGGATPTVYGRIFEDGVTQPAGAPSAVTAQLGYGPAGTNPTTQAGWRFFNATYNVQAGNDDEYMHSLTAPTVSGTYAYTYRFSFDAGLTWTYCDADGAGSNGGLDFSASQLGLLTVGLIET